MQDKNFDFDADKDAILTILLTFCLSFFFFFLLLYISGRVPVTIILINFLKFVVIYFICVFIHEIGHLLVFLIKGYEIKVVIIGPFAIINSNKLKLKCITPFIGGGIVIPGLKDVKDEEGYNKLVDDLRLVLITGPFFSAIVLILTIIKTLITRDITILSFFIIISNILIIFSAIGKRGVPGDIHQFIKYKRNKDEAIPIFYNYTRLDNNPNSFLKIKFLHYVEEKILSGETLDLNIIQLALTLYILEKRKIPNYFNDYLNNIFILAFKKSNYYYNRVQIHVIIHLLIYIEKIFNNNNERILNYLDILSKDPVIDIYKKDPVLKYHQSRTKYLLGERDEDLFGRNCTPDIYYSIFNEFKQYRMIEYKINRMILDSEHNKRH
ncbi:site-2 protease family protein [Anaerobranca gottschalkii]|uniref:Peptidase M50 domain-containing protein n=1 Tax=Anaerobranca gottschalkii DSM 13577 TaxID=1120990 RepID=A0A1I0B8S2_9FIRM|nr:site-2 protease family protein [Anaerobranca gottschalkii]SET03257.1 hypothetical protein SAMN03080614_103417 [Anaerobranca gottschalkii DSM 13577]